MLMPAFVLGAALAAVLMRQTRNSMIEVMSADYIRTAYSQGLAEPAVVVRHALRNGLIPVVTILGLQMGALMGGAVVTEQIFVVPGFGRLIVEAVFTRDYPLVQGVVLITASVLRADQPAGGRSYSLLNPRIRVRGSRRWRAERRDGGGDWLTRGRARAAPRLGPAAPGLAARPGAGRRPWPARSWCSVRRRWRSARRGSRPADPIRTDWSQIRKAPTLGTSVRDRRPRARRFLARGLGRADLDAGRRVLDPARHRRRRAGSASWPATTAARSTR